MAETEPDVGRLQQLKSRLAASSRKSNLDRDVWEALQQAPYFRAAAQGDQAALGHLKRYLKALHAESREQRAREGQVTSSSPDQTRRLIPEEELERERVLSRHLARLAREYGAFEREYEGTVYRHPSKVQAFRNRYLGASAISARAATRILKSPAAALFTDLTFASDSAAVPLTKHRSRIMGHRRSVEHLNRDVNRIVEHFEIALVSRYGGTSHRETVKFDLVRPDVPNYLWVPGKDGPEKLLVYPGTVFDRLRELSEDLARRYGWEPADATWFVLTDTPPPSSCLTAGFEIMRADDHQHAAMTLTIQPWVTAETVFSVYRYLQQTLLRKVHGVAEGDTQIHMTSLEQLELFDFVSDGLSRDKTWRAMVAEWNASHPRRRRYRGKAPERNFRRNYKLLEWRMAWLWWERRSEARRKRRERAEASKKTTRKAAGQRRMKAGRRR